MMNTLGWMFLPLKKYVDFTGRARRKEYWLFQVFLWLTIGAFYVAGALREPVVMGVGAVVVAVLLLPMLALSVRRWHDLGKSGWYVFLGAIPYLGALIVLYFMVQDSECGENQYGEDPTRGYDVGAFT